MAKRSLQIPDLSAINDDTPLLLKVAGQLAFPGGGITSRGLIKERDAGRLVTERIAGKEFTTLGHIRRMRELCSGTGGFRPDGAGVTYSMPSVKDHSLSNMALMLSTDRLKERCKAKKEAERIRRRSE
jgi:hypothetical protein